MQSAPEPNVAARHVDPQEAKELQGLVLYKDEHVLVLNKPYGLPVQGGPGITRHLDDTSGRIAAAVAAAAAGIDGNVS